MTPGATWVCAGLGNPGPSYAASRHNVGFRVAATLAAEAGTVFRGPEHGALWARAAMGGQLLILLQPQEYMNRSGPPVAAWLAELGVGPARLLVIHDDLDLELGRLKVAAGGGDGGHQGVRSVAEALGDSGFLRVRVGIGRAADADPAEYVLGSPLPAEGQALRAAEARAAEAVRVILAEGSTAAMNRFNPWPVAGAHGAA